jgi:hypothetical protein
MPHRGLCDGALSEKREPREESSVATWFPLRVRVTVAPNMPDHFRTLSSSVSTQFADATSLISTPSSEGREKGTQFWYRFHNFHQKKLSGKR